MADALPRLTRRQVLQAAAAGGLAAAMTNPDAFAAAAAGKYIDAHSHIWTRDVERYPLKQGTSLADLAPPSFTTEELLRTAAAENVGRVVLIAHNVFYGFDNTYLVDAAREHPETFRVVGMVDEKRPHPDVEMKRLLPLHVTGFRIVPWVSGPHWLDSSGMQTMWRCGAETRQALCCLINPEHLPEVDRMCEKFPATPVVIDHFARIGADGTVRETDLANLCRLARHKHTYVKISAYYALGKKSPPYHDLVPMIRRLYEEFGAERLMWASDSPYQLVGEHTYAASIALVRDQLDFVTAGERDSLLRKTAESVYFFDV